MKKLSPFLAGMATMALIGSLTFSALAASGSFTITVDPINIQVNGATFQPKDAQGKDVPVFTYNGTTYAPLRALAEAYGLEVGYDAKANMATVGEAASTDTPTAPDSTAPADYSDWSAEDEAAYQEFKGMWEITDGGGTTVQLITAKYTGSLTKEELIDILLGSAKNIERLSGEFANKAVGANPLWFYYDEIGIANAVTRSGDVFAIFVGNTRIK